jgi:ParB-like chromosome segregation protein Spo0J
VTAAVKLAFQRETVKVPIAKILPAKMMASGPATGAKAKTIEASVPVVGVIEPPMVHRQPDGTFLLLDGHRRIATLKERGAKEAECLVAFDDESYTFNAHVSTLAPIQANKMIVKALDAGVPEERLASALGRSLTTIHNSRSLLKDISPDTLELLKDKPVASATFRYIKHVNPPPARDGRADDQDEQLQQDLRGGPGLTHEAGPARGTPTGQQTGGAKEARRPRADGAGDGDARRVRRWPR